MDKIITTGTKVWYYDTEAKDPVITESVCCGSFINIESGDVYYYLPDSKQPSFAVYADKAACEESHKKFMVFRAHVAAAQAEIDAERQALGVINVRKELAGVLYPKEEDGGK